MRDQFVKIIEDQLKDLLTVEPTKRKYTFLLAFDWSGFYDLNLEIDYTETKNLYFDLAEGFIKEMRSLGLSTARLKTRYTNHSYYYITFRSIHDVMAFKLTYS